jgi:hypothetical protein
MLNLSRFSRRILPFVSRYEPSNNNPLDREKVTACDICNDAPAEFETSKAKVVWCRSCDSEVKADLGLKEDDISYV